MNARSLPFPAATALLLLALAAPARAQQGAISGVVVDDASGAPIAGANVLVVGTAAGATTDLDGRFAVAVPAPAVYDLRVSFEDRPAETVAAVAVELQGETVLRIRLGRPLGAETDDESARAFQLEDLRVTGERVLSTDTGILVERMKEVTIGDAISAAQIAQSPDGTSSDALRRVTGLSIVDDKYVFVRGVTDRYNGTSLNGVAVTSTDTDTDRKSFSFDMIPANLLANTVVVKTATPDLPGDFSGGFVKVSTLEFPDERSLRWNWSAGFSDDTSTEPFWTSAGSGRDWLGQDDGARALPQGLTGNELARALPNNWTPRRGKAPLDRSLGFSYGDRWRRDGRELGLVAALSYKTTRNTEEYTDSPVSVLVVDMPDPLEDIVLESRPWNMTGVRHESSLLIGALANVNLKLSERHKLSLKTNASRSAREKVQFMSGDDENAGPTTRQSIVWNQRELWLAQLGGEHGFADGERAPGFAWNWHRSSSDAAEPDRKHLEYSLTADETYTHKENYRTWSALAEDGDGGGLDAHLPLLGGEFKAGASRESRERAYGIDAFAADASQISGANAAITQWGTGSIFIPENFGPGKFRFVPITVFTGAYEGTHELRTWYAMYDRELRLGGLDLRLTGGVRWEDSDQQVLTRAEAGDTTSVLSRIDHRDALPSGNLTWRASDRLNLRLAYYASVNRPEFREMSDVLYFDFNTFQNVKGNPDLRRATVDNYDVRLEFFPREGEVVAASWFSKTFVDAIEERLIPSPERFVRTWFNSEHGTNEGYELEYRRGLGCFWGALDPFTMTANYTHVTSAIEYLDSQTDEQGERVDTVRERVMQGQSPWSLNLSLAWRQADWGTNASVLYNRVGRRLDAVGDSRDEDAYEESRRQLDAALTQALGKGWKLKATARNLLDEDEEITLGDEGRPYQKITRGVSYALSFSLDL